MADAPTPPSRPQVSFAPSELQTRINRAESTALTLLVVGALLALVGLLLAVFGKGLFFLLLGGILFLAGGIENVRAEILKLHARLEKKD